MIEIVPLNATRHVVDISSETKQAVELFMAGLQELDLPPVSKVLLYGSRARGGHQHDSDVDMAVVLEGSNPGDDTKHRLTMLLAEVSSKTMQDTAHLVDVSANIIWEDQLHKPEKQRNPDYYQNLMTDGIEIIWTTNNNYQLQPA